MSIEANDPPDPRDFEKKTQDELDDILNSALDELENDEDFATAGTESRTEGLGDPYGIKTTEDEDEDKAAKAFQTLLDDFSNPDMADSLEKAFQHLSGHVEGEQLVQDSMRAANTTEKQQAASTATIEPPSGERDTERRREGTGDGHATGMSAEETGSRAGEPGKQPYPRQDAASAGASGKGEGGEFGFGEGTDMDRTIARTLEMLSKSGAQMEGQEAAAVEAAGEDVMQQMMGEFEKMGKKEDYNEVMNNVMQQLLSRELMYDPIKQICDKYPEWLATHRESLPPADYQRYGKQYQSFQRVLAIYETEPENFPRLMEIMQDMQEHGQVPAEIIKELAPGLEFNAEGVPMMPNMGGGMMPNFPGGGDPENCCIS